MADHMTAREALRLALEYAREGTSGPRTTAEFERARKILDALVEAHEAENESDCHSSAARLAATELAKERLRAIERGEETP